MPGYLKHATILLVTVGLVALFLRQADLSAVARELSQATPGGIILALVASVTTYVFRTIRWQYLLLPSGHVPFWPACRATVIGFGANAMLPGRVGEVIRPYLLARTQRLDPTATFATIVLERALDMITLLLLFAVSVACFDSRFAVNDGQMLRTVQLGGLMAAAAALAGLVMAFVFAGHADRVGVVADRLTRPLPARVGRVVLKVIAAFGQGFAVLRSPAALGFAFLWSVAVWLSIALMTWLMARAFGLPLPFAGTFTLLMFMAVGVSVPTPGGVGAFHESVRLALTSLYAADNDRAVAYAVALHALSFIPISLAALVLVAREGLSLRRIGDITRDNVPPSVARLEESQAG
ncbi:MAG: flippase-like domain-containing protein [Acidobacteria bacterium]|nr:flippase-like domain-containing protein [Acidobacteriota bacterium]